MAWPLVWPSARMRRGTHCLEGQAEGLGGRGPGPLMQGRGPVCAQHVFPDARSQHLQNFGHQKIFTVTTCKFYLQKILQKPPANDPSDSPSKFRYKLSMSEQQTLTLDRRHRLIYSPPNQWAVQQIQPDGRYDTIDTWTGGQRSVRQWCDAHDVTPVATAKEFLGTIPETGGFKDR